MPSRGRAEISPEGSQLHGAVFYNVAKQSMLSICPRLETYRILKYSSQMLRTVLFMGSFQTGTT